MALLPLAEAIERVDPVLREVMSERLRADFRQVIRWESAEAGERLEEGNMFPEGEGLVDPLEDEESER